MPSAVRRGTVGRVSPTDHRCLIVDDSPTFCAAARRLLEGAGMVVVDTVPTLEAALATALTTAPSVILVDVDLGGESGFDVVESLDAALRPCPPMVMVSTHDPDDFADLVEASPAIGFLQKFELSAERLVEVLS